MVRGLRERAAFDAKCPELRDGCLADLRELLEMELELTIEKVLLARACRRCSTAITMFSYWSMAFVSVLFVAVSTPTNSLPVSLFFFGPTSQGQQTRRYSTQIWQKSKFRATDFSEILRLDIDGVVVAEKHSCTRLACSSDPKLPATPASPPHRCPAWSRSLRCLPTDRLQDYSRCAGRASSGLRTRVLEWHRVDNH